jgi:hypothetical protein
VKTQILVEQQKREEIIRFDAGKAEIFVIKDEGIPYEGNM